MSKKIKIAIVLLGVYLLVFLVGFKSGSAYMRMQKNIQFDRVEVAVAPADPETFYVVENIDYGGYSRETIEDAYPTSTIIKVFMNEKLRPLLKSRDIKIYNEAGERIY